MRFLLGGFRGGASGSFDRGARDRPIERFDRPLRPVVLTPIDPLHPLFKPRCAVRQAFPLSARRGSRR
ncbi:MAG: hypothetical protein ACREV3_05235, partial [Gammaproteobacteria bacterium]